MYICLFRLQMQEGAQNNSTVDQQKKKKAAAWRAAHWRKQTYKG